LDRGDAEKTKTENLAAADGGDARRRGSRAEGAEETGGCRGRPKSRRAFFRER